SVHHATREAKLHGLGFADLPNEPLRASGPWHDPQLNLRLTELGGIGGDNNVAHHCELAATPECEPGDGGYGRLAQVSDAVPAGDEILFKGRHVSLGLHLLDVGAGRECLLAAGNDYAANAIVGFEALERRRELLDQLGIQRVKCIGAIEPDNTDAAAGLGDDGLVRHGFSLIFRLRETSTLAGGAKESRAPSLRLAPHPALASRPQA